MVVESDLDPAVRVSLDNESAKIYTSIWLESDPRLSLKTSEENELVLTELLIQLLGSCLLTTTSAEYSFELLPSCGPGRRVDLIVVNFCPYLLTLRPTSWTVSNKNSISLANSSRVKRKLRIVRTGGNKEPGVSDAKRRIHK